MFDKKEIKLLNNKHIKDIYNTINCKWKHEELCRYILENIFDCKFNSIRPDFLKNPDSGYNLEIDCYNDRLKLGLEYNGIQHYKYPNVFHKTIDQFKKQINNDSLKYELCKQHKITLIIVPYNINKNKIFNYILIKLIKSGYIKLYDI
jgi:hypothetical protein